MLLILRSAICEKLGVNKLLRARSQLRPFSSSICWRKKKGAERRTYTRISVLRYAKCKHTLTRGFRSAQLIVEQTRELLLRSERVADTFISTVHLSRTSPANMKYVNRRNLETVNSASIFLECSYYFGRTTSSFKDTKRSRDFERDGRSVCASTELLVRTFASHGK